MKRKEPSTFKVLSYMLWSAVSYNILELIMVAGFVSFALQGAPVTPALLWFTFGMATVWTLITSTKEAQDYAKSMVLSGDLFVTDFLGGVIAMLVLAFLAFDYGLQFAAIFLLASLQNLRYTVLSVYWIHMESKVDQRNRDKMSGM